MMKSNLVLISSKYDHKKKSNILNNNEKKEKDGWSKHTF